MTEESEAAYVRQLAAQIAASIFIAKVAASCNNEDVVDLAKRLENYLNGK